MARYSSGVNRPEIFTRLRALRKYPGASFVSSENVRDTTKLPCYCRCKIATSILQNCKFLKPANALSRFLFPDCNKGIGELRIAGGSGQKFPGVARVLACAVLQAQTLKSIPGDTLPRPLANSYLAPLTVKAFYLSIKYLRDRAFGGL